mgnify:CR=1 FL=1
MKNIYLNIYKANSINLRKAKKNLKNNNVIGIPTETVYGLAGYISGSHDRAVEIARQIRTGNMHVNGAGPDFNAPFGGYKQSGNGREWGTHGLEEFLEVKAILGGAGS